MLGNVLVQIDGTLRHNGRDRMLVDELGLIVTAQQNAKTVEPGDDALQLHAIHQEYRDRHLLLADFVEENVLERSSLVHVGLTFLFLASVAAVHNVRAESTLWQEVLGRFLSPPKLPVDQQQQQYKL